ncbi:type VI secretion system Vgr family protein [Pseudooceanicola sp. C21-150M6]|uniref:type VI secretion system Vgr family protein n=1 Tax=Pseudooceanicola sp. C21-150M6 TaxID=3434355 RepID=UPI003D7FEEA6
MATKSDDKAHTVTIESEANLKGAYLIAARITEGMSQPSHGVIELVSEDPNFDVIALLGEKIVVVSHPPNGLDRHFPSICTSVEHIGASEGTTHFRIEFRSWFWFMTKTENNRVFQDMTVPDMFTLLANEHGYPGEIRNMLNASYPAREFTVQYGETDFDFLSRLFEEEGIYYFFGEENGDEVLFLCDAFGTHEPIEAPEKLLYRRQDSGKSRESEHIYFWQHHLTARSQKWVLRDYNFLTPKATLEVSSVVTRKQKSRSDLEVYQYPGHHENDETGERRAKVRMEAEALQHHLVRGEGTVSNIAPGRHFELKDHPRKASNDSYLLLQVTHTMILPAQNEHEIGEVRPIARDFLADDETQRAYKAEFAAFPLNYQYRSPLVTPWPNLTGAHTATVVGPDGEEIYCDEHGRVKVQFPWDREGANDETSSCWVRCMMPWTGKEWGMIHIPRIGQEVVVMFESGDPDRPIIIGMVYNADTMPPYALPNSKNISGLQTRSTIAGTGYHELIFDDTKGSELVRFQSQLNYHQIVKNNATISIGEYSSNAGDLTQTIQRHRTETIKTGDLTTEVSQGNEVRSIAADQTVTIGNNRTEKVGANTERQVGANETIAISANRTVDIGASESVTIASNLTENIGANHSRSVSASVSDTVGSNLTASIGGSVSESVGASHTETVGANFVVQANASIELSVGASSIKITPAGIIIDAPMVTVNGKMTKVSGSGMLILNGGMTMIN